MACNSTADDFEILEPSASPILESLRAFGYSPETAIADIVDNSISADATVIDITFVWKTDSPYVLIADNGRGMSEGELVAAMRLGSRSPHLDRAKGDLGRFGLGLKTASFSQGRELTVVTRDAHHGPDSVMRRWDLDEVQRTNQWRLLKSLSSSQLVDIEVSSATGTVVVWSKLDRLLDGAGRNHSQALLLRTVERVAKHLELVFHRFLLRPRPITISVNGKRLTGWDPFARDNLATISTGVESLPLGGSSVQVEPFVLPHRSKMSADAHELAGGAQGWNASQGYYVFREDRLLVAGSWLGIGGMKEEHAKLARISLDIPAKLDHLWQVDVRKASVKVPSPLLTDLRRISTATRKRAQEVYRFRGKIAANRASNEYVIAWVSNELRGGATKYTLNRRHPLVESALLQGLSDQASVERLLRFVEETIPVTQIGIGISGSLDSPNVPFENDSPAILDLLEFQFQRQISRGRRASEILDRLASSEPFTYYPQLVQIFREAKS
jgi:hypothetical protein